MKHKRQLLVRNLVLAIVAADAAGIYFLKDKLNGAGQSTSLEDDAIAAAAAQPAPQAARELPRPGFGQVEAGQTAAEQAARAEVAPDPVVAPAKAEMPVAPSQAAAPAPAKARVAAVPAPAQPKVAAPALKTIKVSPAKTAPRALVASGAKKPVTLSVAPTRPARLVQARMSDNQTVRTRASFRKAFSGLAHSAPAQLVSVADGSLHSSGPAITAHFSPAEAPLQMVDEAQAPEITLPVVASELASVNATAPIAPTASEMPAAGE